MPVRLLITADLHFNHPRSRGVAVDLIGQMNRAGGDAVLLVGDTGISDGGTLEECLALFQGFQTRLFVAGNHELWTRGEPGRRNAVELLEVDLPARVRAAGWQYLQGQPVALGAVTLVGSVGWYDYSFAQHALGIPDRFYAAKVSPGAAARFAEFAPLFDRFTPDDVDHTDAADLPRSAMDIVARWNDGRHVLLPAGFTDASLLERLLGQLEADLNSVEPGRPIIAAVHCVPFQELLPPAHGSQWDFAKAYLGSGRIGELLMRFSNVRQLYCGHSHLAARAQVGHVDAENIGSGYRLKTFKSLDI